MLWLVQDAMDDSGWLLVLCSGCSGWLWVVLHGLGVLDAFRMVLDGSG